MKVKTTKRYHYLPIRMAKNQNTDKTKFWTGCGTIDAHSLLVEMHNDTVTLEDSLAIFNKIKYIFNHRIQKSCAL